MIAKSNLDELLEKGAKLSCYDPEAMSNVKTIYGNQLVYSKNTYDAVQDADAIILLTEWNRFRELDLTRIYKLMNRPVFAITSCLISNTCSSRLRNFFAK